MTVNISARFTEEQKPLDGLVAIEKILVEEPLTRHVIVAIIETSRITQDIQKGTHTPTVRLVAVEAVDGDMEIEARTMLTDRFRARTGREDTQPETLFDSIDTDKVSGRNRDVWLDDKAED